MTTDSLQSPVEIADAEQLEAVQAEVAKRLQSRVHEFHLLTRDNGLVLKGRAHSYHVKQLAQSLVQEFLHMPIVANEMRVWSSFPRSVE
jgi:hypothetical protein